jgi:hypothetical protein
MSPITQCGQNNSCGQISEVPVFAFHYVTCIFSGVSGQNSRKVISSQEVVHVDYSQIQKFKKKGE